MYYIGVDGGGTKTVFTLSNEKLIEIYSFEIGSIHYKQVTFEGFEKVIKSGIKQLLRNTHLRLETISYFFLGIPGYGESSYAKVKIDKILSRILPVGKYTCGNECLASWCGALDARPGVCISSGTGSIAFGLDYKGNYARAGGWGFFCGDQGSAFWIGKKVIELFCKESDNCEKKSLIYKKVKEFVQLKSDYDIIDYVTKDSSVNRVLTASFAKIAYEAAKQGDEAALLFFEETANELADLASSVIKKLDFQKDDIIYLSFSGGLFAAKEFIQCNLLKYLKLERNNIEFVNPKMSPSLGACLLAQKISSNDNFLKGGNYNDKC